MPVSVLSIIDEVLTKTFQRWMGEPVAECNHCRLSISRAEMHVLQERGIKSGCLRELLRPKEDK